jgi:DNA-binding LytR/AlgR family response regulator
VFNLAEVKSPVIFTTSYDEYALKAFKVNSVDYLLKPIQKEELQAALQKYRQLHATAKAADSKSDVNLESLVRELQQKLQPKEFRKRFLVKHAQKLVSVEIDEIAYFYSDGRLNFFKTKDNKKYVVDYTMDELEDMLDPEKYFRISRSFYVSVSSIDKIDDYFGNRLILQLKPAVDKEAWVSLKSGWVNKFYPLITIKKEQQLLFLFLLLMLSIAPGYSCILSVIFSECYS